MADNDGVWERVRGVRGRDEEGRGKREGRIHVTMCVCV